MENQYEDLKLSEVDINNNKHRDAVGGLWESMGRLQFEYLVKNELKPSHTFLDIGCGAFRGGIYFIPYLQKGNYYGIDINQSLIEGGKKELKEKGLLDLIEESNILVNNKFEFCKLNQKFDFILAQSVFTHLSLNSIYRCLLNVNKVLNEGGKFYATFFESNDRFYLNSIQQAIGIKTFLDRDPYHYHYSLFEDLVKGLSLKVNYIGDWGHPRNQKMLCFTK